MFKAGVGSLDDFTGEKLAKSCSDDMLAQFVIQTTFSFGVQKGTDKAAKRFGKGFSNKMSKYVGKAGTTSTISGPKIGDANIDMPETFKVKDPEVHSESPMFGEDWNSYFKEKYGEGNVTWESAPEGHIDNPNTLTYKTFEKETFSSGFDYESMYEKQYLDDFSYEEHFSGGVSNSKSLKSGIKNSYGKTNGSFGYQGEFNSEYNLLGEKAHEHLTIVEGFNKKKGGIIGGHTKEAFDSFSERPVNILSKEKLGDGIYEYIYQVGTLERGQYKENPDGSYVWLNNTYTKTVINTEELSINTFEKMAQNAFANEVIYETEGGQLYIKGVLENGVKVEGYIDKTTMELISYYPCSEYNNKVIIKGVFKNE